MGSKLEDQVINGVAYPVTTYSWVWHICQVGRYGAGGACGADDPVMTYAKACTTRPASFSLSPQQISDVEVTPLDATTTAKVFLQSVVGSQNQNSGCSAGQERYVITMNLVYFESVTNSKVATGATELVHDIVSPVGTSGIFDVPNDLEVTEIGTVDTNNVEQFLTVMRAGSPMTEGIYLLEEEALTDTSADFYRYQKVILLTKCYNTEVDAARGTRGNPNALVLGLGLATADDSVLLQTKLVAKNSDNTKRTTLDLRILASQESFKLPDAESMTAKEVQAEQTLYGSYEQARTNLGSSNGLTFDAENPLKPGAQICSKHQIEDSHAAVAHLSVNSVGACLVSAAIPVDGAAMTHSEIGSQMLPGISRQPNNCSDRGSGIFDQRPCGMGTWFENTFGSGQSGRQRFFHASGAGGAKAARAASAAARGAASTAAGPNCTVKS